MFYLLYGVIVLLHYPIAKYREVKSGVMSLVRQNFHEECEDALNKQINVELYASYVYLSMVSRRNGSVIIFCVAIWSSDQM